MGYRIPNLLGRSLQEDSDWWINRQLYEWKQR